MKTEINPEIVFFRKIPEKFGFFLFARIFKFGWNDARIRTHDNQLKLQTWLLPTVMAIGMMVTDFNQTNLSRQTLVPIRSTIISSN